MAEPAKKAQENKAELSAKERFKLALLALTGLREVEALVKTKLSSQSALLEEIGYYLLDLGGKRMRPALCLLVAKALGNRTVPQSVIEVAAGIELIHMATLLHDDIIDKSPLRRHQASPFVKYGPDSSLLAGDFLLTRAFSLCAHLDQFVIEATEQACMDLTEGEIMETPLSKQKHTIHSSIEIGRKKTAALFKLASLSSAHLCGVTGTCAEAFAEFGEKIGIAFQILDDVLDVTSSEEVLGKKAGVDIHERKPSVVNVLWSETGTPLAKKLLEEPQKDEEAYIEAALKELNSGATRVISQAKKIAISYSREAETALQRAFTLASQSGLKLDQSAIDSLQALVTYTIDRME